MNEDLFSLGREGYEKNKSLLGIVGFFFRVFIRRWYVLVEGIVGNY